VVPVAVGAAGADRHSAWRIAAALIVALALQVGVNYANDYFDGVRGVDAPGRVGPPRLTASGLASPAAVAAAAILALGVAMAAGAALALAVHPWLLGLGAAAVIGAVLYSGGPRPYAARGLGELAVFVFFGPVAVAGTAYVQSGDSVPPAVWWASIPVGLLCVGILMVNNLRDITSDAATGKRTLAVRLGEARTRTLFAVVVAAAFLVPPVAVAARAMPVPALLMLLAAPVARPPLALVRRAQARALLPALAATARLHLVAGALLGLGLALR
jgi:1,4-dihydroxy-2-naphthoate octaprenyltransferase